MPVDICVCYGIKCIIVIFKMKTSEIANVVVDIGTAATGGL